MVVIVEARLSSGQRQRVSAVVKMSNVVEQIVHFQRKLEKYSATNETDKVRVVEVCKVVVFYLEEY